MQVKSLIHNRFQLDVIDVQVVLLPGLPQIQFLGQADSIIKESAHRIRSAIKNAGFQFPTAQQVLVDLKPHEIKKRSLGVELAVAYCILVSTGQIEELSEQDRLCFYGELGLRGEVYAPQDLWQFDPVWSESEERPKFAVMTGKTQFSGEELEGGHLERHTISDLNSILSAEVLRAEKTFLNSLVRPDEGLQRDYSEEEARVMSFLALGEHSILIAGAAGVGKTTLANGLPSFLKSPLEMKIRDNQFKANIKEHQWRPVLKPHFTSTVASLIGGGDPLGPGDLTRAHGGVLILDEFLEFQTPVQEALRTPMEEKKIILSRGRNHQEFACQALIVATTNLCPCGKWTPGQPIYCSYNLKRCRSVLQRFSGPLLDRFEVLYFKQRENKKTTSKGSVKGVDILERVERARSFRKQRLDLVFASLPQDPISLTAQERAAEAAERDRLDKRFLFESLFENESWSYRRQKACLRLAGTLADLEMSEKILPHHVEEAFEWSCCNFLKLNKVSC